MRILLVEDDRKIARLIQRAMKEERYAVDVLHDGDGVLSPAASGRYDLIILDIMLPGKDGLYVCRELRKKGIETPVLMLTARDRVEDKVCGLDVGADDYLTKPFSFDELSARVRALLRRTVSGQALVLSIADLVMDRRTRTVTRAGSLIPLSSKEFALLEYLVLNANFVLTRTMIAEQVWKETCDTFTNVIDVYIRYLRNKIDKPFPVPLIHTLRGKGYMLSENVP